MACVACTRARARSSRRPAISASSSSRSWRQASACAAESRETDALAELGGEVPEGHREILQAESEAEAIWIWEPQVVPGLIQTEDYTRSLLNRWGNLFARPAGEIERRAETKQLRQRILTRSEPPPPELSFVIDESVLFRALASPRVMRNQLAHLIEMSHSPNVDLRVLHLRSQQIIVTGAFNYFRFPQIHGVWRPDAVAFEHMLETTFTSSEIEVNSYKVAFSAVRGMSLSQEATRDILAKAAAETWVE